jgi:hypothetical protein
MELDRKRDESIDVVLALSVLLAPRGLGGICRNHDTATMLWDVLEGFGAASWFGGG